MTQVATRYEKYGAKSGDEITTPAQITMSVEGQTKTGKNHFAFSAPGPIAVLDIDRRLEPALDHAKILYPDKEFIVLAPEIPWDDLQATHTKKAAARQKPGGGEKGSTIIDVKLHKLLEVAWDNLLEFYRATLNDAAVKTVIIDTGDKFWELLRMTRFGKMDRIEPHHYGPLNSEFERIIKQAKERDTNLIILSHMKNDYKTGRPTRVGFSQLETLTDVNLRTTYDEDKAEFQVLVRSCGLNIYWTGEKFTSDEDAGKPHVGIDEVNFPYIAACITGEDDDPDDARLTALGETEEWE